MCAELEILSLSHSKLTKQLQQMETMKCFKKYILKKIPQTVIQCKVYHLQDLPLRKYNWPLLIPPNFTMF